jgi:hypothetical protein
MCDWSRTWFCHTVPMVQDGSNTALSMTIICGRCASRTVQQYSTTTLTPSALELGAFCCVSSGAARAPSADRDWDNVGQAEAASEATEEARLREGVSK